MDLDENATFRTYCLMELAEGQSDLEDLLTEEYGEYALVMAENLKKRYKKVFEDSETFQEPDDILPLVVYYLRRDVLRLLGEPAMEGDVDVRDTRFYEEPQEQDDEEPEFDLGIDDCYNAVGGINPRL